MTYNAALVIVGVALLLLILWLVDDNPEVCVAGQIMDSTSSTIYPVDCF